MVDAEKDGVGEAPAMQTNTHACSRGAEQLGGSLKDAEQRRRGG
jgi:hypothetical protein